MKTSATFRYLSESQSQDKLLSLDRSSSEWKRLSPQRCTAWATEKRVLPAAQASILDTVSCDCRKRCRQLSDKSSGLWRILHIWDRKYKCVTVCNLKFNQSLQNKSQMECLIHPFVFVVGCHVKVQNWSLSSILLFQKILQPLHSFSYLSGIVQAEERVFWRQLWKTYPVEHNYTLYLKY